MKNLRDIPAEKFATDHDHRIIDSVSVALGGAIGAEDDAVRLHNAMNGSSDLAAYEIAVAFIRWAQDLKAQRNHYRDLVEKPK